MGSTGAFENHGYPLELALYLEGVRVPFIRATVSSTVNNQMSCTIDLPPFPSATRIRPRTLVQLFYYNQPFINTEWDINYEDPSEADELQWCLLFEGEVSHIRIMQAEHAKQVTIICNDFVNYWYHTYQYFITNQNMLTGAAMEMAAFANGYSAGSEPIPKIVTLYNVQFEAGLGDIVLNTVVGGWADNLHIGLLNLFTKIPTVNAFFSMATTRLKLFKRIFVMPDAQITKYINYKISTATLKYVSQFTGRLGNFGTVLDVVRQFLAHGFYDFVSFPAPPYGANPSRDTQADGTIDAEPDTLDDPNEVTMLSTMFKPKTYFTAPPRCNLMFPSQLSSFQYTKSFLDEPTRIRLKVCYPLSSQGDPFDPNSNVELVVYAPPVLGTWVSQLEASTAAARAQKAAAKTPATMANAVTAYTSIVKEFRGNNLVFDLNREISEPETGIIPTGQELDINQTLALSELTKLDDSKVTIKEKLTLVLDPSKPTGSQTVTTSDGKTVTVDNTGARHRMRYYIAAAEYQLDVKKFTFRTCDNITGPFNPRLLLGFPAAVLSSLVFLVGELTNITHTFDVSSGATTSCSMSHVRNYACPPTLDVEADPLTSVDVMSYYSPVDGTKVTPTDMGSTGNPATDFPFFYNNMFKPENISEDVYLPVFGTQGSDARVKEEITVDGITFSDDITVMPSLNRHFQMMVHYWDYVQSYNKIPFVNFSTKRKVATLEDVCAYYNIVTVIEPLFQAELATSPVNEFLFGGAGLGPVFKPLNGANIATKQLIILDYTKEMRAALGSDPTMTTKWNAWIYRKAGGASGN